MPWKSNGRRRTPRSSLDRKYGTQGLRVRGMYGSGHTRFEDGGTFFDDGWSRRGRAENGFIGTAKALWQCG